MLNIEINKRTTEGLIRFMKVFSLNQKLRVMSRSIRVLARGGCAFAVKRGEIAAGGG
jgi:hypothetical protein